MELSKKAQRIEPSVTLEITAKAKEMKENGVDVISFGAGEPDFNTPKNIIDAAIKAMNDGNTKYTSVNGILPLREAICKKFKEDNGLFYKPSQIVVSTGAKQSLANTFLAISFKSFNFKPGLASFSTSFIADNTIEYICFCLFVNFPLTGIVLDISEQ